MIHRGETVTTTICGLDVKQCNMQLFYNVVYPGELNSINLKTSCIDIDRIYDDPCRECWEDTYESISKF